MIKAKSFMRNINFTTSATNYELLADANILTAIKERLGLETNEEATNYINENHLNMYFEIYFSSPQSVSVNSSEYYPTMMGDLYYSGDFIDPLQSIRILNSGVSGQIALKIK